MGRGWAAHLWGPAGRSGGQGVRCPAPTASAHCAPRARLPLASGSCVPIHGRHLPKAALAGMGPLGPGVGSMTGQGGRMLQRGPPGQPRRLVLTHTVP